MKHIFLIGDSIRLGYQGPLAGELSEYARLYYSEDNARFTTYTLRYLHEWAQAVAQRVDIDLVHWNNGLWDACHWHGDPLALVPLDQYVFNLGRIHSAIQRLFPKATIVFATTTPVGNNHPRIRNEELQAMNTAAVQVLSKLGVQCNDLNKVVAQNMELLCHDATHFTQEGYSVLGSVCASYVRSLL